MTSSSVWSPFERSAWVVVNAYAIGRRARTSLSGCLGQDRDMTEDRLDDTTSTSAASRGVPETDLEAWAFEILRSHLTDQGHRIDNVRRPDVLNRSSRDVDFLIDFDGREVAVEVTRLDQERQWWVLLDRLQDATVSELRDWPSAAPGLVLTMKLLRTGSHAEVDRAALAVAGLARDWARVPMPQPVKASVASDLVEVELRRPSTRPGGLMIIRESSAHDAWLGPRAAEFVRKLIDGKATQGQAYAEVWLLVIDNEIIIGLDLITQAFAEVAAEVPSNWKRVYLLPAVDRDDVQCLSLGA